MAREKRIDTAAVGAVTLTFDLDRIQGNVIAQWTDDLGKPWKATMPVTDLIGAVAKMGNAYIAEAAKVLAHHGFTPPGSLESCGHKEYDNTGHCAEMFCSNYINKHAELVELPAEAADGQ